MSHEYFKRLLIEAARAVELPTLSSLCRDRLNDVRMTVESIATQVSPSAALRSTITTERLTQQMLWLSILVALLAIAQIALAIKS